MAADGHLVTPWVGVQPAADTSAADRSDVTGILIVGCPRSGSTLLQAMMAQHPQVLSFPETHFFSKIRGRLGQRGPAWLVSPRAAHASLRALYDIVGAPMPPPRMVPPTFGAHARAFERAVAAATAAAGRSIWLEKSPVHLHAIESIQRHLPRVRFVHIIRDGRDVAASMYDLCLTLPDRWVPQVLGRRRTHLVDTEAGRRQVLDAVIDRWNHDVERSLHANGRPGHVLVSYGDLVGHPERELVRVCDALAIGFVPAMLRHWESAEAVVGFRGHVPHMQKPFRALETDHLGRFRRVFDAQQRRRVTRRLLGGGDLTVVLAGHRPTPGTPSLV